MPPPSRTAARIRPRPCSPPSLAVAQERGLGGRELITAFVAGAEVMFRIGYATKHSNETRGFHAPGTTGPFGAAVAVGKLRQFDAGKMTNALGIAGSLACGLLEFVSAGNGAMVKRLHLGRAAESGVLAASLADDGFTGPSSVLEGEFGFLHVFCNEWDLPALTRGLGTEYLTRDISLKRYACHMTAQNSIEATQDLRAEHKFSAADVVSIAIAGDDRMATRNNIPAPEDKMLAQYSVPFSVALSLYRDARDPRSFDDAVVHDRPILDLASRIKIARATNQSRQDTTSTVTIRLKDGREVSRRVSNFMGTPQRPLDQAELKEKFMLLMGNVERSKMEAMFERLQHIENEKTLDWVRSLRRVVLHCVMPALVAGTRVFAAVRGPQTWMAGTIGRLRPSSGALAGARAMPGHDEKVATSIRPARISPRAPRWSAAAARARACRRSPSGA